MEYNMMGILPPDLSRFRMGVLTLSLKKEVISS
jgi:hypothetical protein